MVLRQFIAGANSQYRAAGLGQYQMRVARDGSVSVPRRPPPTFRPPQPVAGTAPQQASAGAAATAGPGTPARRSGPAPKVVDLRQSGADAFQIEWQPVAGARQYGIWQDGVLLGHVPSPRFAGTLASGASGTIEIDAVRADGTRTELTRALRVSLAGDGRIRFDVPGATPAPSPVATPTVPAAPAG